MKVQKLIKTDEYDEKEKGGLSLLVGDFAAAMTNDNITTVSYTHLGDYGSENCFRDRCGGRSSQN